MVTMVTA